MLTDTRAHIFIVEDNQTYSMMLDYILSKDSIYKFSSFRSGEECLRNLYQDPDAIILDYALPGMNGYDVLLEIKKYNPAIHVLILTGNNDMKLAKKLLQAGADDYILKQDHGEKLIIEKIEALLSTDQNIKVNTEKKMFLRRLLYVVLAVSMVMVGMLFYKTQ
jgi:CheY-like chemotaxis protein